MRSTEVARLLQINLEPLCTRVRNPEIPAHRDDRRWKFDPAKIGWKSRIGDRKFRIPALLHRRLKGLGRDGPIMRDRALTSFQNAATDCL
jgi:hypothetical protein